MTETGLSNDHEQAAVGTASSFDSLMKGDNNKDVMVGDDSVKGKEDNDTVGGPIDNVQNPQQETSEWKCADTDTAVLPSTSNESFSAARNTTPPYDTKRVPFILKIRRTLACWPRTKAILGRACLLWTLILWALLLGYILALLEGPAEIVTNNEILQQRWFFSSLPWEEVFVAGVNLPAACMKKFIDYNVFEEVMIYASQSQMSNSTASLSLLDNLLLNLTDIDNTTIMLVQDVTNNRFPNITLPEVPIVSNDTAIEDVLESMLGYMEKCDDAAVQLLELAINATLAIAEDRLGIGPDSVNLGDVLTFNWIRCWDNKIFGDPNPWKPTQAQIDASANQSLFFRQEWTMSQQQLLRNYIMEGACFNFSDASDRDKCILNAAIDSVLNATGGDQCATNTGGKSLNTGLFHRSTGPPNSLFCLFANLLVPLLSRTSFCLVLVYCHDDGRLRQSISCDKVGSNLGCILGMA
jgi:hypothetical protein